jgi:lambda repressor-like predicted transcriptional regulator
MNSLENDWIREAVAARAEERGLTAYAVAKEAELDPQTVKRFMKGRCALNSRYVSRILDVLGLVVKPGKRVARNG